MMAEATLRSLRDVDGVLGSFVINDDGVVLASDLPAFFDQEALGEAGPRLRRLLDAINSRGKQVFNCLVRFTTHVLWVHPFDNNVLCVVAPSDANVASLRMGSNLVVRRLPKALRQSAEQQQASMMRAYSEGDSHPQGHMTSMTHMTQMNPAVMPPQYQQQPLAPPLPGEEQHHHGGPSMPMGTTSHPAVPPPPPQQAAPPPPPQHPQAPPQAPPQADMTRAFGSPETNNPPAESRRSSAPPPSRKRAPSKVPGARPNRGKRYFRGRLIEDDD